MTETHYRNIMFLTFFLTTIFYAGCSEHEERTENNHVISESAYRPEYPDPDVFLLVVDSIGVEIGDSNYVFASPSYTCYLPDSNIVVVDQMKPQVSLFSSEGSFIALVGREGNGPGEYLRSGFASAMPSGGLAVTDNMQRRILFYNEFHEYVGCTDAFSPAAPSSNVFLNDSTFLGVLVFVEMDAEDRITGWQVSRFNTASTEPDMCFFRNTIPFDPSNVSERQSIKPMLAVIPEEIVFISVKSQEQFLICAYSLQGDSLFSIEEPFSRIAKSEMEIEAETQRKRDYLRFAGAPEYLVQSVNAEPFYNAIKSINIGPDNNLWVTLGGYNYPVFRVYDSCDGSYLYTATLEDKERFGNNTVIVNRWGFTAYNRFSELWPRIYILEADMISD